MSNFQFPINEMKRAAGTAVLSAAVAACYFAVMPGLFTLSSKANEVAVTTVEHQLPHRPAGGRRWRSSNAEPSLSTLVYFSDDDHWGRNRARLEGAMSLFQMGGTFSSAEIAGGTMRVTLTKDYLAGYLATPFLGADEPIAFALESGGFERPLEIAPVLARTVTAELFAQK